MKSALKLLRRRWWASGAVIVVTASVGFAAAGLWQLDRLDERRTRNTEIELAAQRPVISLQAEAPQYSRVTTTGEWLGDSEVAWALQTRDGQAGFHLLAPLLTSGGVYLVDRGWVPLDRVGEYPRPSGEVALTATVREAATGQLTNTVEGDRRVISRRDPEAVGKLAGVDIQPIVLDLVSASPNIEPAPLPPLPIDLSEGRHLLYAVQWFSFIGIVVIGFSLLVRRQLRSGTGETGHQPSLG